MTTTHFAFPNTGILCGQCGSIMSPDVEKSYSRGNGKWRYIVYCGNKNCLHFEIRYLVPKEAGIQLERFKG